MTKLLIEHVSFNNGSLTIIENNLENTEIDPKFIPLFIKYKNHIKIKYKENSNLKYSIENESI